MSESKKVLYETVHRGPLNIEELADRLGVSVSYLYRATLDPNETPSGARFPYDLLLPLMLHQKNYSILFHLGMRTGHIVMKIPRVPKAKLKRIEDINKFQENFNKVFGQLLKFLKSDGKSHREETTEALYKFLCEVAGILKMVEKFNQLDLPFKEE
jgi:hypothetical protein